MSVALKLYEQLTDAGEDKQRAHVIAEAFEKLEERYPEIKDLATQSHVCESELRLLKEIKEVEGKIKETESRLQKEIKEQMIAAFSPNLHCVAAQNGHALKFLFRLRH